MKEKWNTSRVSSRCQCSLHWCGSPRGVAPGAAGASEPRSEPEGPPLPPFAPSTRPRRLPLKATRYAVIAYMPYTCLVTKLVTVACDTRAATNPTCEARGAEEEATCRLSSR